LNLDRWLVPAFSTDIPMPERRRNEWPFFIKGAWVVKPDYRGQMLYRTDTGTAAEILAAGVTLEEAGLTDKPRPSDQYVWSNGEWAIDAAIVAEQKRAAAMQEFETLLGAARAANSGKSDAYAAGLLSPAQAALFRAWANYQLALVRVIDSAEFPDNFAWPVVPDADAIAAKVEAAALAKAQADAALESARKARDNAAVAASDAARRAASDDATQEDRDAAQTAQAAYTAAQAAYEEAYIAAEAAAKAAFI